MVRRNKSDIESQSTTLFADNTSRDISPGDLRSVIQDMLDSGLNTNALTQGRIPMFGTEDGVAADSSISEGTTEMVFAKSAQLPGGTVILENFAISAAGPELIFRDRINNQLYGVASRPFSPAGSGTFSVELLNERSDDPTTQEPTMRFQPVNDEVITVAGGSSLGFNVQAIRNILIDGWITAASSSGKFYIRVHRGTGNTDPIDYESHEPAMVAAGTGFDFANTLQDSVNHPFRIIDNQNYFVEIIPLPGESLSFGGTTITQAMVDDPNLTFTTVGQQVPFIQTRNYEVTEDEIYTDSTIAARVRTIVRSYLHAGDGITLTPNADNTQLTISSTTSPPQPTMPRVTSFSIQGQSATIVEGSSLSGSQTFLYSVENSDQITGQGSLIQDPDGTPNTLLSNVDPTGSSVAATIDTVNFSAGVSETWRLQFTSQQGGTISRDFTIRAREADESAYYGVLETDTSATVDVSTLTQQTVNTGTQFDITLSVPNTQFVVILVPSNHDLSALVDTLASQNILNDFTRTANARTIGGQTYNSYVHQNQSGFDGNVSYQATTA